MKAIDIITNLNNERNRGEMKIERKKAPKIIVGIGIMDALTGKLIGFTVTAVERAAPLKATGGAFAKPRKNRS